MNASRQYAKFIFQTLCVLAYCIFCSAKSWAVACDVIFTNGIQATGASGNINLSYHSIITGGSATLKSKTLTDNSSWVACSGSSCVSTGAAATTSTVAFSTGTGSNGSISVTTGVGGNTPLSKSSGDYTTVSVAQQATLIFTTANGTYKTTTFTTNLQSVVQLQSGDYWINGNLTLGQETVLQRIASSGTTRIFVNGNVSLGYKVATQNFTSAQLLIYATGTITGANQVDLSAYIYAGGAVSFGFQSSIDGGVSGSSFTASGNEVGVNYQPSAFSTANFAPFCSGTTVVPVLLGSWNMDELSWNGTAGEVKDTSGNNNHGRARVAVTGNPLPSTTSGGAALTAGNQSTCRYGAFDGTGSPARVYDYVELSGFPTLPNGFTFAAWIRSTNAGAQHQRILVRDDADNGWGLSLADGTGNPALRFFNRNVTNNGAVTGQGTNPNCGVFCVDTNAVISSNTWYYVAAAVDTTAKTVTLYVYSQGGTLQAKAVGAYSGTWVDGTGTVGIGGETSASAEGRQTSWHFLGNIDEVNIYSGALAQTAIESLLTTVRTCPAPDHYELDLPANGIACMGTDVTVRACADSVSPCTNIDYSINTNVSLATSAGALTATTVALSSGSKTIDLFYPAAADNATATVTLSGEVTAATNARKCCIGGTCTVITPTNVCTTTFNTSGFIFSKTLTGGVDNPATQIAGKLSNTSPDNNMTYLRAVRTNTSTGACGARLTSTQTVKMAYKCVNPTTCIAGETLKINSTTIQANANAASPIVYSDVNLTFDANGSALIPINYSDVGQVQLFASLALGLTSTDPAYTLTGTSNLFVVKPYDLNISTVQTLSNVDNPTTTQSGSGFVAAGATFKASVNVYSYYTNILNARVTPNFGRETSPGTETVGLLIDSVVNPVGGNAGALANPDSFARVGSTGATFSNSGLNWSEVGTVNLKAHIAGSDYLGAGDVIGIAPVSVGRFHPDHFRLLLPLASNSCGAFTYMGQPNLPLSYRLQAENLSDNTVTNYNPAYSSTLAVPVYSVENLDSGSDLNVLNGGSPRFTASTPSSWTAGVMTLTAGTGTFARLVNAGKIVPDGSYDNAVLGLRLNDSLDSRTIRSGDLNTNPTTSGNCVTAGNCTAAILGSSLGFRFGRLRLDDAFGPETFQLPVNFLTEYWAGNRFIQNANDSCTLVPRSAVQFAKKVLSVDANRVVGLSGGSTTGVFGASNVNLTATDIKFSTGTAGLIFTAPNGGTGSFVVEVDLTTLPWLRADWNQDEDYSDIKLSNNTFVPNATINFGSYRGNDRIIYWREKLQ